MFFIIGATIQKRGVDCGSSSEAILVVAVGYINRLARCNSVTGHHPFLLVSSFSRHPGMLGDVGWVVSGILWLMLVYFQSGTVDKVL